MDDLYTLLTAIAEMLKELLEGAGILVMLRPRHSPCWRFRRGNTVSQSG